MHECDARYQRFNIDKQAYWADFAAHGLSSELKALLNAMLHPDPALRPTPTDILTHAWMTSQPEATQQEAEDELRARLEIRRQAEAAQPPVSPPTGRGSGPVHRGTIDGK